MKAKAVATKTNSTAAKCKVPVRRAPFRLVGESAKIQPSLKVGAANDPLEHEADAMAERVVTMSEPAMDAPPPQDNNSQPQPQAQRAEQIDQNSQPNTDTFESAPQIPTDHQDPDVPNQEDVDTANLEADEFAEIESGEPNNPKGDINLSPTEGSAVGAEGGQAPNDVVQAVAQPGVGRPLPASVRHFMEPRFGVGFSDVRIHDKPDDQTTAERIGARAFTYKNHIWLGKNESVDNRRLMAHELTHVVQQTKRPGYEQPNQQQSEKVERLAEPKVQRGWLANKAEKIARNVPGYTLLCVILGKSPITGNRVDRTATNLVGGFLGLLPGGNLIFEKLKESKALENAFEWVRKRLSDLDITWSRVKRLVNEFIDEKPIFSPIKTAKRIFGPLVDDLITFVGEIKDKILEFIVKGALKLAGPYGEKVWAVIEKVRDTISMIINDPLGFAKNLVSAIVKGFKQFGSNIWKHIKAGLMGWLFGTLQGIEIELPEKLDFKGIVSVALQILGLTYENFRKTLVKRLGRKGEEKVSFIEKSVEVVKILVNEGFVGIWQRVLDMIDNFKSTVIDGIKDFVINTIVMGAISWVAGLSNPIGGIVKIALSIYNMIKTFLERLDQILEVANSIFSSIGAIAKGQIQQAADFIEKTIAATIPVFLAFVAALIPVTGITKSIRNVINKLQQPVKKAMDKMITFLVKKTKKLFSKLLGKLNKKRKVPAAGFKIGKEAHKLIPKKKGNKFTLNIASDKPQSADKTQTEFKTEEKKAEEFADDSKCVENVSKEMKESVDNAESKLENVKPEQQKTSTKKTGDAADKAVKEAGDKLGKSGPCIADNPTLEDEPEDGSFIRAIEPRIEKIEGEVDTYSKRGKETKKKVGEVATKAGFQARGTERLSNYYENDHIPENSMAKTVRDYIDGPLKDAIDEGQRDGTALPKPYLGGIDTVKMTKKGNHLPVMTVYRPLHRQKTAADSKGRNHDSIKNEAETKLTPVEKIATLRIGIQKQMQQEIDNTAANYSSDKNATEAIRAKIRSGITKLNSLNKALYGTEPGEKVTIPEGPSTGEGSPLPMTGAPENGIPNFFEIEGEIKTYNDGKGSGFGNYIEYDHIIESSVALAAKGLTLESPEIKEGLNSSIEQKAQEAGSENSESDEQRTPKRITTTGKSRITKLKGNVFPTQEIKDYTEGTADTIALYRPVHKNVPDQKQGIGDILKNIDLAQVRENLVDYAVTNPKDDSKKDQAIEKLRAGVNGYFVDKLNSHTGSVKSSYATEATEFKRINPSKKAASKMDKVLARVNTSLQTLREKSLSLIN